ncbi:hypothetical protein Bca4012_065688 [Brassica carinata]
MKLLIELINEKLSTSGSRIFEAVICAFGRLGTMFGCDKYIKPDLVSLAKALSSAYMPTGAILMSQEVADAIYSQSNKLGAFLVMLNVVRLQCSDLKCHLLVLQHEASMVQLVGDE